MSDVNEAVNTTAPATAVDSAIEKMNALHVEIGEKAAELALQVLEAVKPEDIPVASAVSLLKFGVELQRKALLGAEDDAGEDDPFDALAKALTSDQNETPKQEEK